MPLRPASPPHPAWDEIATDWELAAKSVRTTSAPAVPPTEDQAHRILRAMRALADAGVRVGERFAGAFDDRDDVSDALHEISSTWEDLRDLVDDAADTAE